MNDDLVDELFRQEPHKWFGMLCEALQPDERGRFTFSNVISQFRLWSPPTGSGIPPHAHVQGILTVGAIGGMGQMHAEIMLTDPVGKNLWDEPQEWHIELRGAVHSAVWAGQIDLWLTEPGTYRFLVHMREFPELEWTVPFEVASRIGPDSEQSEPS